MINIFRSIQLSEKVDEKTRKKVMIKMAIGLNIPEAITSRNKYGFVDAFKKYNK